MKDQLKTIIKNNNNFEQKLNLCREYLQSYILLLIQKNNFFDLASFVGGTCLRFIYNLPRFSEDLDFSLKIDKNDFDFMNLIKYLKYELEKSGYLIEITYKDNSNVYTAMVKFSQILYEFGISPNNNQKLNIKIDIDTNPPQNSISKVDLITKYFPLTISHYNLSSILTGKINAIFTRNFTKGRDYYDIFWILSHHRETLPNIKMLHNALNQFDENVVFTNTNWKKLLFEKIKTVDMKKVYNDVNPFIENSILLSSFNQKGFELLLNS